MLQGKGALPLVLLQKEGDGLLVTWGGPSSISTAGPESRHRAKAAPPSRSSRNTPASRKQIFLFAGLCPVKHLCRRTVMAGLSSVCCLKCGFFYFKIFSLPWQGSLAGLGLPGDPAGVVMQNVRGETMEIHSGDILDSGKKRKKETCAVVAAPAGGKPAGKKKSHFRM